MRKQIFKTFFLLIVFFMLPGFSKAAVITFQAGDGKGTFSQTDDGTLDTAGGSNPQSAVLRVGRKDSALQRFALRFPNFIGSDGNQIPEGVKINSATIKLKETSGSYYNTATPVNIGLYKILEDWQQSTVSGYYGSPGWYYRINSPATLWTNLGIGPPQSSSAVAEASLPVGMSYGTTFSFDVTHEVQNWVSTFTTNRGFVFYLQDETTLDTSKEFNSSEATNVSDRPILQIDYTSPDSAITTPPVISNVSLAGALPVHTTQATLTLTTDNASNCKYSTTAGVDYAAMTNVFSTTGGTTHSQNIAGLVDGGSYDYYVKCLDYNSNVDQSDYHVSFSVSADTTPPAQIQNLAASNCDQHSCALSWTATGDDAASGTAAAYDIRYSKSNITNQNWTSATQIETMNEPTPQAAGKTENLILTGLDAGSTYFFAIKARDAASNWSSISNVPTSVTQSVSNPNTAISAWTIDSNTKIRPQDDAQSSQTSFAVSGAQNETVSLQFAINTAEALNNVDVNVNMPGFSSTIYREDFMHVITPSHSEGDTGEWPDILIPKVDTFYGETRNAFPVTMSNISRAYPFIAALPTKPYGPTQDGKWYSNEVPASGYVWPYDGTQIGTGASGVYNQGTGKVSTSGTYLGTQKSRYIIVIDSAGAIGSATFKWSADNGATFQTGVPTSASQIALGNGVDVTFAGAGQSTDFAVGDEWVFYVAPSRNQPIWIDVQVPKNMAAGMYSGSVSISADNKTTTILPIALNVYNFSIPDTSSLKNYFGAGSNFTAGHDLPYTDSINKVYVAAGLRDRISLSDTLSGDSGGGNTISCSSYNETTGAIVMNYGGFDNVMGAFLDGTGSSYVPAGITFPGKLTTFTEPSIGDGNCTVTDSAKFLALARADFANHIRAKGWMSQFYVYLADEPSLSNQAIWDNIIAKGQQWRTAAPDVSMWVTTTLQNAQTKNATDYIDVYIPNAVAEVALGNPDVSSWSYPRANFNSFVDLFHTPPHDVWWYSTCIEAGSCGPNGGSYFNHWASYGIDSTAIENIMRIWQARYYDYHGELYYATDYDWDHYQGYNHIDPWDTSYYFGDNGDGQLFYPGRPDKIGGTTNIPIESLRLKLIRNGMQDYEYMHKLDLLGDQNYVQNQLSSIMSNVQVFSEDPADLARVKDNFASRIETDLANADLTPPAAPSGLTVM